jgi:hypothetical protein
MTVQEAFQKAAESILEELPQGPLTRYYRDLYTYSGSKQPFDEWQKEAEADYEEQCRIRNLDHPVIWDKEFVIDGGSGRRTVHLFLREGEDWICDECDMGPGGGSGSISLQKAIDLINNHKITSLVQELTTAHAKK